MSFLPAKIQRSSLVHYPSSPSNSFSDENLEEIIHDLAQRLERNIPYLPEDFSQDLDGQEMLASLLAKAAATREYEEELILLLPMLLKLNYDLNYQNKTGIPLLVQACQTGLLNLVKIIADIHDSDPNSLIYLEQTDSIGRTPFYLACKFNQIEIVRFFLQRKDIKFKTKHKLGSTPFFIACFNGSIEIVSLLLKHTEEEIKFNFLSDDNYTPFYAACSQGRLEIVRLLTSHNLIDVNMPDQYGISPLAIAAFRGHYEVVHFLIEHPSIDFSLTSKNQKSLYCACQGGEEKIVRLLMRSKKIIPLFEPWMYITSKIPCLEIILSDDRYIPDPNIVEDYTAHLAPENYEAFIPHRDFFATYFSNPEASRKRFKFKITTEKSAELFAQMVLLCDDYLNYKKTENDKIKKIYRFFKIARELPMDLQMVLANRTHRISRDLIPFQNREEAFKETFRDYHRYFLISLPLFGEIGH